MRALGLGFRFGKISGALRQIYMTNFKFNFLEKILLITVLWLLVISVQAREVTHETNPESGVQTWELHDQGVGFTLMQITPDQARGFFLARGFDRAAVDYYATYCVFMTIVRNEAVAESINYKLSDWEFYSGRKPAGKLKLAEDWLSEWKQRKVAESSLIAFQWALHPSTQTFETGDWNQGMTTYALPLGSTFNLKFKWNVKGVTHESMLENIQCASETAGR